MTSISEPPGKSNVRPLFGIPLLLSSSMLVGASGRPGFLFDFLSLSLSTSRSWLPILGFDGFGVASVYRLRTRAALSLSRAVSGAFFTEPLTDSTDSLAGLVESEEGESTDVVVIELSFVSEQDTINLLLLKSDLLELFREMEDTKGEGFNGTTLVENL